MLCSEVALRVHCGINGQLHKIEEAAITHLSPMQKYLRIDALIQRRRLKGQSAEHDLLYSHPVKGHVAIITWTQNRALLMVTTLIKLSS